MAGGESESESLSEFELEFPDALNLSSLSVINTINDARSQQGDTFFCTLCSHHFHNDMELYNHLMDKRHTGKLAIAKITLLKSNPWPFHDAVNFFNNSPQEHEDKVDLDCDLVISDILHKGKVLDLGLRFMGFGQICIRFLENCAVSKGIKRIWCEWLGKKAAKDHDEDICMVEEHDFAVIVFGYYDQLGTNVEHFTTKSFSDSSREKNKYSQSENSSNSSSHLQSRLKEIFRREYLLAGEELCSICQRKMVPGTSVAALFNTMTGRLSCSSKTSVNEFHVFHVSCLIHWILICECEIWKKKSPGGAQVERSSTSKRSIDEDEKKRISCVFCPDCHGTGVNIGMDELEKSTFPLFEEVKYNLDMTNAIKRWILSPEELQNGSTGLLFESKSVETVQVTRFLVSTYFREKVSPLKLLRFYHVKE